MTSKCQCCGEGEVDEPGGYEICGVCGWEDDPSQAEHPGMAGGANDISLDEARKWWTQHRKPLPSIGDFPAGGASHPSKLP